MIPSELFTARAKGLGFATYTGVPCSYLSGLIEEALTAGDLRYIGATNEGDAVAVAAGLELGGCRAIVMMQNSGLGNAVSPLTSLLSTFKIPVLLIVTLRGEPGGPSDEPQHEVMGRITRELLDLIGIPWSYFPEREEQVDVVLSQANASMITTQRPFALVMKKGAVGPARRRIELSNVRRPALREVPTADAFLRRSDVLRTLKESARGRDVLVATTGYTGRELYALGDTANQIYVVGSMGCASSLGLGLALAQPSRRVVVLDGDGAALMRLGALCAIAQARPANLFHVLLDNGLHESTGGQGTAARSVDLAGLATASGYPVVASVSTSHELKELYDATRGQLTFAHVPIRPGVSAELPRPAVTPEQVAIRLRRFFEGGH